MVNARKDFVNVTILFLINLLNFVDRYTVAGVLTQIQSYYHIDDSMGGLIQTVFLIFFMVGSPVCGYLGDRFSRKLIIIVGVSIWLVAVIASTFVPANLFWMFLLFRGIVGIGEASYSNVCPSMISDMFTGSTRSKMFMLFYFAIPVGSGLGFIVGSNVASLLHAWQWGVRVSAVPGLIILIVLILIVDEPKRGAAELIDGGQQEEIKSTSYLSDLKALVTTPTFVTCTWAYTALIFVTGTLTWWEPTIIQHSIAWTKGLNDTRQLPDKTINQVGLIFGAITMISGLVGVSTGTIVSGMMINGRGIFRYLKTDRAQPIVSGVGALIAAPLLLLVFLLGHSSITLLWVLIFVVITFLCFNWGLNVDMLMMMINGRGIFRYLKTDRAQPIVSGVGALIAAPLLLLVFLLGHSSITLLWVLIFVVITFLCFNWGLNVDMLMVSLQLHNKEHLTLFHSCLLPLYIGIFMSLF
ncbi:unnamed protein product [Nippostrongylus brasiliensis]|uniref:MFS domain-containing protein n=1 Tax=Nippostrongylus brasiliensis TaxID=27835 RepID=A0A0N4YDN9_NIPBR|nr:unnamed protein product [Nippostrongylus brasiliensis]